MSIQLNVWIFGTMVCFLGNISAPPVEDSDTLSGVISLEDLMGGFRVQQLSLSNTMLNTSRKLGLGGKLAQAEVQEAEERTAKAFRATNEAKTPFIATTSRYNLGYIGRGYDIYYGNPLSDDGQVDPGFRLPVIDLPFSFRFTSDGEYRIPDNVDVIAETSASFGSSLHSVKTSSDYQKMLKTDASVNFAAGGWGLSASFSASYSSEKSSRETQKAETTTLNLIGKAIVYKARLTSTAGISKVSDFFESAITALPMENCDTDAAQSAYLEVIKEFGTHYTTEVVMGAKAVQELKFKQSDLDKLSSQGVSAKVAAQLSYSGFGVTAGGGASFGSSSSESQRNSVSNTRKEKREYYIGGNPPPGSYDNGDTESLREWARSAAEKPAPIQYKLSSIDSILRPEYFKKLTYGFYERRMCMARALITHCSNTVNPNACRSSDRGQNSFRRKRSTDSDETSGSDIVKYGDFIKLSNGNSFLALAKVYGYSPGTAVKLLTAVTQITDYDGIFQVTPLEDQPEKLGTELLNGEPFQLQAIDGEKLYIGRALIPNVDSATPSQKMLFDNDTDEIKLLNQNQAEDYSVFLKNDKKKMYMISLRLSSRLYGSQSYQVNLYGENGFIRVGIKQPQEPDRWIRKTLVESDVGEITKATIMGRNTYYINAIAVKTVVNGQKKVIRNMGLNCYQFVNPVTFRERKPRKTVDIDVYPAQFSFNGKNDVQDNPVRARSIGFLNIISSMPKQTFWGRPVSQLLSFSDGKVGLSERGPPSHSALSSGCDIMIYPDDDIVSRRLVNQNNEIIITFQITMMINSVTIYNEINQNFSLSYLSNDEKFVKFSSEQLDFRKERKLFTIIPRKSDLYTNAIKLYSSSSSMDKTELVIYGCPSGFVIAKDDNSYKQEWKIDINQNEIRTYPHLSVIPKVSNKTDINEIIRSLEQPVSGFTKVSVPLPSPQIRCTFDDKFFVDFLASSRVVGNLRISNLKFKRISNKLEFSLSLQAINQQEYDMGLMYLSNALSTAVGLFPCGIQEQYRLADRQTQEQSISGSSVAIGITIGVALFLLILLFVVGFMYYRSKHKKSHQEKGNGDCNEILLTHRTRDDDCDPSEEYVNAPIVGAQVRRNIYSNYQENAANDNELPLPPRDKQTKF